MAVDFKKEQKELYAPPAKPHMVEVPPMNFVAVRGSGDPNQEGGAYQEAVSVLYAVSYTLRMSYKGGREIPGFFQYTVPPLEGLWWQEGVAGVESADYARKGDFRWISLIRLPDFVTREDLAWAVGEASRKKKLDCSGAAFFPYHEGLCVQCMHLGSYDDEPATIAGMNAFAEAEGYGIDMTVERFHHEIYLSDPRKTDLGKRRTVIRHPVKPL